MTNKEYWVKHDWREGANGKVAMLINCFTNKEEAEVFAATTKDGVVVELTLLETIGT